MQRKALGKGLKALLPDLLDDGVNQQLQEISVSSITPNKDQPRKKFKDDKLEELANSIKEKGIIQPIVVRKKGKGFELIAGERRWRAVQKLGYDKISAIVKKIDADADMFEVALIENIQRENLGPIEEAEAYQQLIDKYGYTQEKASTVVGKERSSVANFLRLLKLPGTIKQLLSEGLLTMGHARTLLGLDLHEQQEELGRLIVKKRLSVREVEVLVAKLKNENSKVKPSSSPIADQFYLNMQDNIQKFLGTKVKVKNGKKGGKLEIYYHSDEEFERIYGIINPS